MALKDIVLYPDSPLTEVCEPIESFDSELADLAADMFETMDTSKNRYPVLIRATQSKAMLMVNPFKRRVITCPLGVMSLSLLDFSSL